MPIHIRAEPGDYADAVLLPGDPLRAKYIAETYLDDVVQRNGERGLLGYTGTFEGKPVSVQGTGMGCPGATIVFEELIQLGCKRLIRVGTCGGLQPHHALGDLIVALSAVPADSTAMHLVGNEPHCPTASWSLVHEAVHLAKHRDQQLHVGPIVSSDLFYNPDEGQYERWSKRGVLGGRDGGGGALHGRRAPRRRGRLPAHRQRHRRRGRVHADQRRGAARGGRPDDAARARGRGLRLARTSSSSSTRRAANGSTGKRWPKLERRAAELGLAGETRFSQRPGPPRPSSRAAAAGEGALLVVVGGDGTLNEVVNGVAGTGAELAVLAAGTGQDFGRTHGIPAGFDDAVARRARGRAARRSTSAASRFAGRRALVRERRLGRDERRGRARARTGCRRRSAAARPSTTRSRASSSRGGTPR